VARLAPRLAVRLEVHAQFGQVDVAQADEERRPARPTHGNVSLELAAMRRGGCGFWTGVGETTVVGAR